MYKHALYKVERLVTIATTHKCGSEGYMYNIHINTEMSDFLYFFWWFYRLVRTLNLENRAWPECCTHSKENFSKICCMRSWLDNPQGRWAARLGVRRLGSCGFYYQCFICACFLWCCDVNSLVFPLSVSSLHGNSFVSLPFLWQLTVGLSVMCSLLCVCVCVCDKSRTQYTTRHTQCKKVDSMQATYC